MQYKTNPKYPKQPILKETKHWHISLWENQYYLGRASIEIKDMNIRHISELSIEHILELFSLIKSYENTLRSIFGTTNFNWACLMNDSYKGKNFNNKDPLHFHVYPRYRDRVVFRGEVFVDEVFAHHYDKNKEKIVSSELLNEIADRIADNWVD